MGLVELQLERIIHAPVADVFARLADIDGHNTWMRGHGSILHGTEKTSPGPPGPGTTYVDRTRFGTVRGEIVEFAPPTTLLFHWWDASGTGRIKTEGWPGYRLEAKGDHTTLVHHHVRLETHGPYRPLTPVLHWIASRERTTVLDALETSFGHHHH